MTLSWAEVKIFNLVCLPNPWSFVSTFPGSRRYPPPSRALPHCYLMWIACAVHPTQAVVVPFGLESYSKKWSVNIKEVKLSSICRPLFLAAIGDGAKIQGTRLGLGPSLECFGEGALHQALRARNQTSQWVWGRRVLWEALIPQPDRVIDSSEWLRRPDRQRASSRAWINKKTNTVYFISSPWLAPLCHRSCLICAWTFLPLGNLFARNSPL